MKNLIQDVPYCGRNFSQDLPKKEYYDIPYKIEDLEEGK
jgi:hypothetical protein